MDSLFLSSVLVFASICEVHSYASGAPAAACGSLMPSHGVTPQTSATPYSINVSSTTYEPNQQITVTITGPSFQGLLIQARLSSDNSTSTGTFSSPPTNTQTTKCTGQSDSWTHSNTIGKVSASVTWTAPSQDMSDIVFMGTVAQGKLTYWVGLQSEPLVFMQATTQSSETTTANNSVEETTTMGNNADETTTMSNHGVEETTTMSNAGDETTTMSNDGGGSTIASNDGGDTSTANHNADETTTMSNHGGGQTSTVSNNADESTMSNNQGGTTIAGNNSVGETSTVSNNAGGTTIAGNSSEVMTTPNNGSTRLVSCFVLGVLLVAASIM